MADVKRIGEIKRKTKETEIFVELDLDGNGLHQIDTEINLS